MFTLFLMGGCPCKGIQRPHFRLSELRQHSLHTYKTIQQKTDEKGTNNFGKRVKLTLLFPAGKLVLRVAEDI